MTTFYLSTGSLTVRGDILANDTLSGFGARNGVTPVDGDLMLATAQTDQTQNGPYIARSGAWDRIISVQTAQLYYVSSGTDAGVTWQLRTAGISPGSFNSTTGACGTNLSLVSVATAAGAFNPLAPGTIGGTTPGIVNATDLYLAMSTGSPVSGKLQLAATASTASLVIIAGGGSNTSLGQDPSTNTARAAIRTLSITLADNGTYDFGLTGSSGGSAVIATTNGSIVATVGFTGAGVTTTGGVTYDNFSTTLTTPAKLNVGASGGALRFENKTGGPLSIVATITLFIAA